MLLSKQVLKPAWLREQYTRLAKLYCTSSKQQVDKLAFKSQRLKALKDVEKYPHKFYASADVKQVLDKFSIIKSGEKYEEHLSICGMVTNIREMSKKLKFVDLDGGGHKIQLKLSSMSYHNSQDFINDSNNIAKGDRIGVTGYPMRTKSGELSVLVEKLTLLAPCLRQLPSSGFEVSQKRFRKRYLDFMINNTSRDVIVTRSKIIKYMRNFLENRGFLEVETPILGTSFGGAAARPFTTLHNDMEQELVMRVAPELYLKQMVVGGFDRVFEIGKQFRNEGVDHSHNPEFTSCEFYQAYADYNDLMQMTEDLLRGMVEELGLEPKHNGKDIHFQEPFTRLAFIPSLESACGTSFPSSSELDSVDSFKFLQSMCTKYGVQVGNFVTIPRMLDKLMGRLVEPELIQPTYLVHHPKLMSPLAKEHREVEGLAERFELFIGGKEVANAYTELNNPEEQRAMLISQAKMEDPEGMVPDEDFCISLEYGLPPTAGWGCGLDRLVMILCNQDHIRDTITFPLQKQL